MTNDYYIYYVDMPPSIHEMITPCEGGYTIYIDQKRLYSRQKILEAYNHARIHVMNEDWEKSSVQEIEHAAHKKDRSTSQWNGQD